MGVLTPMICGEGKHPFCRCLCHFPELLLINNMGGVFTKWKYSAAGLMCYKISWAIFLNSVHLLMEGEVNFVVVARRGELLCVQEEGFYSYIEEAIGRQEK